MTRSLSWRFGLITPEAMDGRMLRLLLVIVKPSPRPLLNLMKLMPTALVLKLKLDTWAADSVAGFMITADWSSNRQIEALLRIELREPNCIQA